MSSFDTITFQCPFPDANWQAVEFQTKDMGQLNRHYFMDEFGILREPFKDSDGYHVVPFTGWITIIGERGGEYRYYHFGMFDNRLFTPIYLTDELPPDVRKYLEHTPSIPFGDVRRVFA